MTSFFFKFKKILNNYFKISERNTTIQKEIIAGITTFISMIYSIILIPNMLSTVGFQSQKIFFSTCLVAIFGSMLMGFWVNLPLAIGSSISLTAFITFNLILIKNIDISIIFNIIFLMGIFFTIISITSLRKWILYNIPIAISHGIKIGFSLFFFLLSFKNIGIFSKDLSINFFPNELNILPVFCFILGIIMMFILKMYKIPGNILLTILFISIIGFFFDSTIKYNGFFSIPEYSFNKNLINLHCDIFKIFNNPIIVSSILTLIITSIFDATGTIFVVAEQANLLDNKNNILNSKKALLADSISSIFSGIIGGIPAAVYIESSAGTSVGGRTGLTTITISILFILILFISPLIYLIPKYAISSALTYVGLLMLNNIFKINLKNFTNRFCSIITGICISLKCNIIFGITIGLNIFLIMNILFKKYEEIKFSTCIINTILIILYIGGWTI